MPNSIANLQTERLRVILACILLLNVESLAQGNSGSPALGWQQLGFHDYIYPWLQTSSDQKSQNQRSSVDAFPSQQAANQTISVARLRVPRKARELCEKAKKQWLKNEYAAAQQTLSQALQQYPAHPEALTMSGFIQLNTNQWSAAEMSLQAAVKSDPTFAGAFLLLGELYIRELRFDDALAVSQHAVHLIPDAWNAQYQLCRALIGKRQYVTALSVSENALRVNKGTLLHIAKAHALLGLGRYTEATTELRTYLQYQPTGEGAEDAHGLLAKIESTSVR